MLMRSAVKRLLYLMFLSSTSLDRAKSGELVNEWKSTKRKETTNEIVGSKIEECAMRCRFGIRELEVCDEGWL
jgi:hypothetical protein